MIASGTVSAIDLSTDASGNDSRDESRRITDAASMKCLPQPPRDSEQRLVMLHHMLATIGGRHHCCGEPAATAERDEAVEDGFVVFAEHALVVVRSDTE